MSIRGLANGSVEIEFEQDKHSVQNSGHPYQDGHKNFWHTLHVWLEAVRTKSTSVKPSAFCFVTNKAVPEEAFVRKLSQASRNNTVSDCVRELRTRALNTGGKAEISAKAVVQYSDEEIAYVIQRINLLDEHGTINGKTPQEAVIDLFHLPLPLETKAEEIYHSLLGMLIDICEQAWLKKEQAWIEKSPFSARLHAEIRAHNFRKVVEQPWMSLSLSKYLQQDNSTHHFLRQLRRFDAPTSICNSAIDHFWGFYAERVRLIEEGDVLPQDWEARNSELRERWLQKQGDVQMNKNLDDCDISIAKSLYSATMNSDYRAKLGQFNTTNLYFTTGNYHALANDNGHQFYIYWHEEFAPPVK